MPDWPKLAWVAVLEEGSEAVAVYHGPMVETSDDWIVEAVWAGDFEAGDFDRTDLVFGSGVRVRGPRIAFVSSGTTFDCLWRLERAGRCLVSNSLPAVLAFGGAALSDDYPGYSADLYSITLGLEDYVRDIPLTEGHVSRTCYNNLVFEDKSFEEVAKPDPAPTFETYADYHGYLAESAGRLGRNLASADRAHRIAPLASVSSGYDSSAAAAVARDAGCRRAATIQQSSSLWRGTDSGRAVAHHLGLSCRCYGRTARAFPFEEAVWAATGRAGDLNLTLFDYPEPLSLFFAANQGDKVWSKDSHPSSDPFAPGSFSGRGLREFRLLKGMFHCVLPFWGIRHALEIHRITVSEEMARWTLDTDYDRPIPRRILEEAGVPRGAFGMRKKNVSHEEPFRWPYSPEAQESFRRYLRDRGVSPPSASEVAFMRALGKVGSIAYKNTLKRFGVRWRRVPWLLHRTRGRIFQWGNHELKELYADAILGVAE